MDFEFYETDVMRTSNPDKNLENRRCLAVIGLSGEVGEVAELYKKALFHGKTLDKEALLKELGDVLWYLTYYANTEGFTMSEVAQANIDKRLKRYPEGFSIEASAERKDEK